MRSPKPYTNEAFTKRVDHEAGRHRPSRSSAEPKRCTGCGAVYVRRRWRPAGTPAPLPVRGIAAPDPTICPACRMIADGRFSGEVRLQGSFVAAHRSEIERLISNEAERAGADNPLARIIVWLDEPKYVAVRTTTEHLAQRLGEALHGAFHGRVHYGFSHENKFAHVTWHRDLPETEQES